jgi:hypothetical protein
VLIILEGTDGAGKTTLARQLATEVEAHGESYEILHAGPPEAGLSVFDQYALPLLERRDKIALPDHLLILDRWHLGELIYGPLLRGKSALEPEQFAYLELLLESLGATKVVVNATDDAIRSRVGLHRGDPVTAEQAINIQEKFLSLALRYQTWGIVASEPHKSSEVVFTLLRSATLDNHAPRRLRSFNGYVGSMTPKLLLVGDEPSGWQVGDPVRPAFYPDVNGSSSNYLLRSLLANMSVIDVGFCNANDGTDISGLLKALYRPPVVALGTNASTTLHCLNIDHAVVPHPQWVRRFHHRSHAEYGRAILTPGATLTLRNGELTVVQPALKEVS